MADSSTQFLTETASLLQRIDLLSVDTVLGHLDHCRRNGRLFLTGNGGGAGHASHAAADFRSVGIEAYAYDNMSEFTARTNDYSWNAATVQWLRGCNFTHRDYLFVFSVGGGDIINNVSTNLANAVRWVIYVAQGTVLGIVGEQGGTLEKYAHSCVVIPTGSTPQVEGIQAVLWHLMMQALMPDA